MKQYFIYTNFFNFYWLLWLLKLHAVIGKPCIIAREVLPIWTRHPDILKIDNL